MVIKFNSNIKRIVVSLLVFFLAFSLFNNTANAENTIESIDIKAEIQDDGSVIITDHRIFYADEGTEHYVSLGDLADSEVFDFKVFDENGKELEDIGRWDTSGTIEEKAGKSGINYTNDGLELCFGIGQYGRREFTLQYKVTNFVRNLNDDYQAIYWKFINEDLQPLEKATVTITNTKGYEFYYSDPSSTTETYLELESKNETETSTENETTLEIETDSEEESKLELETDDNALNTRLWGFGFRGNTEIQPTQLTSVTEGNFSQSNYMVVLTIFEGKPFDTNGKFDITSTDLIEKAKQGSYVYKEDMVVRSRVKYWDKKVHWRCQMVRW